MQQGRLREFWLTGLTAAVAIVAALSPAPLRAGSHLWVVNEVFSNADGTVQFVELYNGPASANEVNLAGKSVTSLVNGAFHTFTSNLPPGSTADKYLLLATDSFTQLPGAPVPDHLIAPNSFSIEADTIQWHVYTGSILSFGIGELPTDGVGSLNRGSGVAVNSPTNWAGESGTVDASGGAGPPAVPAGDAGTTPLTVERLDAVGSSLVFSWDTASCTGSDDHILIYGQGSGLPAAPGSLFTPSGGMCTVGASSPFTWIDAPSAGDGSGLVWFLMLVRDGSDEGSWGLDAAGTERDGPGVNGASGQCGVTDKNAGNTCGQ